MSKIIRHIANSISLFVIGVMSVGQVSAQMNGERMARSPEQEALKQTEVMQRIIRLTDEQAEQIYQINLKYATERQKQQSRTEAVERIKRKNEDYKRVLTPEQYQVLRESRMKYHHEQSAEEVPSDVRTQGTNATARPVRVDF
ncbi:MAG: hypothetical protein IJ680_03420 [Paludibacteraceae bacterium]|nr:hypothetical protein [Paludibacteraceae bacterium]